MSAYRNPVKYKQINDILISNLGNLDYNWGIMGGGVSKLIGNYQSSKTTNKYTVARINKQKDPNYKIFGNTRNIDKNPNKLVLIKHINKWTALKVKGGKSNMHKGETLDKLDMLRNGNVRKEMSSGK